MDDLQTIARQKHTNMVLGRGSRNSSSGISKADYLLYKIGINKGWAWKSRQETRVIIEIMPEKVRFTTSNNSHSRIHRTDIDLFKIWIKRSNALPVKGLSKDINCPYKKDAIKRFEEYNNKI